MTETPTPAHQTQPSAAAPVARVFHTLDALRGIAAIGVVVFHMSGAFSPIAVPGGYLAVDLFFIMSGVVLSHAYESRFRNGMGTLEFMRARLIRLYPLYLVGILFGTAVTLASLLGRNSQGWDVGSLVQALVLGVLFLPNLSGRPVSQMFPLNIPCWSLFLEVLVNLLFVLTWPFLTSRRLVMVSLLSGSLLALSVVSKGNVDLGWVPAEFAAGMLRTVFGFSVGVLIARHVPHQNRVENNWRVLGVVAVVVAAIAAWPEGGARTVWDILCVLVVFPVVVAVGVLVEPGPSLRRIATFLGVTSYAVYVLHSPLTSLLNAVTRQITGGAADGAGAPWLGIGVLLALLAGCWIVDAYFDMPVRRYLGRVIPRMQKKSVRS